MNLEIQSPVAYHGGSIPVAIGDHVRTRIYFFFRKEGRVVYVPGISEKHPRLEHSGLRWVGVKCCDGLTFGTIVDPTTGCLEKKVTLVKRDGSSLETIEANQKFIDS